MFWFYIAALLLICAGMLLLLQLQRNKWLDARQRFDETLKMHKSVGWLVMPAAGVAEKNGRDLQPGRLRAGESIKHALQRAGWTSLRHQTFYHAAVKLTPVAGVLVGGTWGFVAGMQLQESLALAFLGFGAGYILPPRILRWRVERRRKVIGNEMLMVLHLLRMLFDAGLSLEHALRIISEQGKSLVPNMSAEISAVLARINAGQERGSALDEMAQPLDVPELNDMVAILKQAARYGGSLRESLSRYAQLIEDRRMTTLREQVSKLSAKMTVVMVLFMFPALMLFLAGPGFFALAGALTRM